MIGLYIIPSLNVSAEVVPANNKLKVVKSVSLPSLSSTSKIYAS